VPEDKDLNIRPEQKLREICEIVGIARNTYYKYTRGADQPGAAKRRTNGPKEHRPAPSAM